MEVLGRKEVLSAGDVSSVGSFPLWPEAYREAQVFQGQEAQRRPSMGIFGPGEASGIESGTRNSMEAVPVPG